MLSAISSFLQLGDIASRKPPIEWPLQPYYLAALALCLLAALVVFVRRRSLRPATYSAIATYAWTNLLIGITFWFFRSQLIPILGNHALTLIHFVAMLGWLIILTISLRKFSVEANLADQVAARKAKYLPKPKKTS
jgi:hypothetical protein